MTYTSLSNEEILWALTAYIILLPYVFLAIKPPVKPRKLKILRDLDILGGKINEQQAGTKKYFILG